MSTSPRDRRSMPLALDTEAVPEEDPYSEGSPGSWSPCMPCMIVVTQDVPGRAADGQHTQHREGVVCRSRTLKGGPVFGESYTSSTLKNPPHSSKRVGDLPGVSGSTRLLRTVLGALSLLRLST
ncbi:hypothetical protein Bbelb_367360 [Branchiostoma belcheri]|nr:hypothetical protein Bbelb_367360 [Branchiostoma belcheri]